MRTSRAAAGLATALVLTTPAFAGCSALGLDSSSETAGTQVVTAFYPLAFVAERVAGGHAEVETLTSPGAEPHDLELTLQQTAGLQEADVVVYARGFQASVDDAVDQAAPEQVVDAAADAASDDPHFWLDPEAMTAVAEDVRDRLSEVDPDHAADFEANFAALSDDLAAVDRAYRTGLDSCEITTVVVSHDAFSALKKYGLDFVAINGLSPDAEPSPSHLAELSDLIEQTGITTVFSETLASPELADTLAGDLGLEAAVLDPIEGLSDATADEDYLSLMRSNLVALQKANTCS